MSSKNNSSNSQSPRGIERTGDRVARLQARSGDGDATCRPKLRLVNNREVRLDTETIFREMIVQELRAGRLNRGQRRRIVRYAAQLGLSAVEAGEFLAECRGQTLTGGEQGLELADSGTHDREFKRSPRRTVIFLVSLALALELLLLGFLL